MRACTEKDFTDRGFTLDPRQITGIKKNYYLCYDVDKFGKPFRVFNFYDNQDRGSFNLNIGGCYEPIRKCKTKEEIQGFLD